MAQVKVVNFNDYPFEQLFKGMQIRIPAGQFVLMEEDDAILFRGMYSPIDQDAGGMQKPESFKRIRIEKNITAADKGSNADASLLCQACGFKASNKWELDGHVNDLHIDQLVDEDEQKKRKAKTKGKTNVQSQVRI